MAKPEGPGKGGRGGQSEATHPSDELSVLVGVVKAKGLPGWMLRMCDFRLCLKLERWEQ